MKVCSMKLNMYKIWKGNQLISVILSRNKKFWGKDVIYYKHTHLLKYLDIIKVNLKIKNIVTAKVVERYHLNNINRNIKSVKWMANKKALKNVGDIYFDLKKIHNARAI